MNDTIDTTILSSPIVSVIVLNWNGREDTLACLDSLRCLTYPAFRVLVVDNASKDGSVDSIRAAFPDTEILETGANLGYAGGNNAGIRYVIESHDPTYILLLNNDTTVAPDFIEHLVATASQMPRGAFFSPEIRFFANPELIWFRGGKWDTARCRTTHVGYGNAADSHDLRPLETDYASGCAIMVRRSLIEQIGLLDERFFLTFEETDWCFRARNRGWLSFVVPQAIIWHKVSVSFGGSESPMANYYMSRNRLLWASRHLSLTQFGRLCLAMLRELIPAWPPRSQNETSLLKGSYWRLSDFVRSLRHQYADKAHVAKLYGIRDFLLRRLGPQQATVERLASK